MKTSILIIVLQLASASNDAYWTDRNQHLPYHYESNPIAAPFVTQGRPLLITYFSVSTALKLALPHLLRKHEHNKLARILELEGIADSTYAGITSAAHSH